LSERSLRRPAQVKACPAIDRNSVRYHLVCLRLVTLRFEGVSVSRVGVKGQAALDRESELPVTTMRQSEERACPTPLPTVTAPAMIPLPPNVPAVTFTGPVPVAEPEVLLTTSVRAV